MSEAFEISVCILLQLLQQNTEYFKNIYIEMLFPICKKVVTEEVLNETAQMGE